MRTLDEHAQTRYFACFALALSATMGVAFAANLFTLFLFYEALTLATYPLVAHKETPEARAGARKYVIYLLGAAKLLLLAAIILTYNVAGTLDFRPGGILPARAGGRSADAALCHLCAVPVWPRKERRHAAAQLAAGGDGGADAGQRASARRGRRKDRSLRHAPRLPVRFGTETMRQLGVDTLALGVASVTILLGSVLALYQDNLKARLAFSTISQLSYIVLGGALLTTSGILGGIAHITNHAVSKITLFFCAGSIYVSAHKTDVSQMSGLARKMPWTMAAFAVASLSLVGIPPASGFVSKWYLALGSVERGSQWVLGVLLVSSLLNAAYLGPVVYKAYFEDAGTGAR